MRLRCDIEALQHAPLTSFNYKIPSTSGSLRGLNNNNLDWRPRSAATKSSPIHTSQKSLLPIHHSAHARCSAQQPLCPCARPAFPFPLTALTSTTCTTPKAFAHTAPATYRSRCAGTQLPSGAPCTINAAPSHLKQRHLAPLTKTRFLSQLRWDRTSSIPPLHNTIACIPLRSVEKE